MIIIDGNGVLLQSILAQKEELNLEYARNVLLHSILKYKELFGNKFLLPGENLIFAFDDYGYWRTDFFPQYKHSRKSKTEDTNWKLVYDILHSLKDELRANFPYMCFQFNKIEADDIIASLTKYVEHKNKTEPIQTPIQKVLIISEDKDFIQLLTYPNVSLFRPRMKEFYYSYNESDISKKYYNIAEQKISPLELRYYLQEHIIRGDSSDGIPNILSDDDVFQIQGKRQKPLKKVDLESWKMKNPSEFLTESTEKNYHRNKTLIDLSEIPTWVYDIIIQDYEVQLKVRKRLNYDYFVQNKLSKLLPSVGSF